MTPEDPPCLCANKGKSAVCLADSVVELGSFISSCACTFSDLRCRASHPASRPHAIQQNLCSRLPGNLRDGLHHSNRQTFDECVQSLFLLRWRPCLKE